MLQQTQTRANAKMKPAIIAESNGKSGHDAKLSVAITIESMDRDAFTEIINDCVREARGTVQHGGVMVAVAKDLTERAKENASLHYYIMSQASFDGAVWRLVQQYVSKEHRQMLNPNTQEDVDRVQRDVKESAQMAWENLMDFCLPLAGYPSLRNATREQLLLAADITLKKAGTLLYEGLWFRAVGLAMDSGQRSVNKTVAQQLKNKDLENLLVVAKAEGAGLMANATA